MAEPWRVAQIVVERGPGSDGLRGSGYLFAPSLVLTAAHVLAGATAVRVRLDVDQSAEIDVQAEEWWADPNGHVGTDIAVVVIPASATAGRDTKRVNFGRISDCAAVLAVQAFGFPRFKLRGIPSGDGGREVFRDLEQVTGHVPVAANRRQGTLAVYLDDPPPAMSGHEDVSPWEGMSGSAVWAGGRVVGVLAEHHRGEGAGRITARRIDSVYEQLPELDWLVNLLGLAPAIGQLPDVVPAGPGWLLRSAYLEQVRDIAPDVLIARDDELAEWAAFCAGTESYAWWQAGPWAGKSALASWFVIHPPAGVDIVSFFITGRLYGQADSDAFLDAMIEQLSALVSTGGEPPPAAGARVGTWLHLLAVVSAQAEERGRRLVVVVDGLDEDDAGAAPPRGRPSIASLLPRRPPPGARFLVTSRPDPGIPDDVPSGHPLRTCIPRYLQVSWVAEDLKRLAKLELQSLLSGDQPPSTWSAISPRLEVASPGTTCRRSPALPLASSTLSCAGCSAAALKPECLLITAAAELTQRLGCIYSPTSLCASLPKNNSVPSWTATAKRSMTGSASTPTKAGLPPPRATPFVVTRACSPRPTTSKGYRRLPATPGGMPFSSG